MYIYIYIVDRTQQICVFFKVLMYQLTSTIHNDVDSRRAYWFINLKSGKGSVCLIITQSLSVQIISQVKSKPHCLWVALETSTLPITHLSVVWVGEKGIKWVDDGDWVGLNLACIGHVTRLAGNCVTLVHGQ